RHEPAPCTVESGVAFHTVQLAGAPLERQRRKRPGKRRASRRLTCAPRHDSGGWMTPSEANRVRWSGQAGPFYEVWYVIAVEPSSGDGLWIRYTLLNPSDTHAEAAATAWFAWTCRGAPQRSFAITRHFAPGSFVAPPGAGDLVFGAPGSATGQPADPTALEPCLWDDAGFSGAIAAGPHRVRWRLR